MKSQFHRILTGFGAVLCFLSSSALAQQMPQTTKQQIPGAPTTTTEELRGTVTYVEGNTLVVAMSTGDLRTFNVPESRRFVVDGKSISVHELKPGTKLTATITTTTTPITQRTTTVGTGKVWYVSGNTVIVTLPNNENRMYKVDDNYRFNIGGQKASVHDLRKGMVISAEKIVEEPMTEIASNTVVTGQAPPPARPKEVEVAQAPTPRATPAPTPAPTRAPDDGPASRSSPAPPPRRTHAARP